MKREFLSEMNMRDEMNKDRLKDDTESGIKITSLKNAPQEKLGKYKRIESEKNVVARNFMQKHEIEGDNIIRKYVE